MIKISSSKLFLIAGVLFSAEQTFSQNAGINSTGATPNASAILDLNTGNTFTSPNGKGLLIPNVSLTSTTDITTVASPANSLIVYNTNAGITGTGAAGMGYYYYSTTASLWINLVDNLAPGGAWMLNGNSGITTPAVPATYGTSTIGASENFLGTTDANDVVFGTSNIERMRIDKTTGHIVVGSAIPSVGRKLYVSTSTASANGAAIWGDATATATANFGVFGSTASVANLSAGVRGYSGATTVTSSGNNAGTWGENSCANGYGAAGLNTSFYNTGGPYSYYGLYGSKQGATITGTGYAVYGSATNSATTNYGGYFTASGATTNVGGYFSGSAGTNNYAIVVPNTGGNMGIGTVTPNSNVALDIETTGRRILGLFGNGNVVTATDNATQAGVVVSAQWSPTTSTTDVVGIDPYMNLAPGAGVTISNAFGLRVRGTKSGAGTVTNGYGIHVDMSPGYGTNKYAAAFLNGNVGIGTSSPPAWLSVSTSFSGAPSSFNGKYSDFGYSSTFTDNTTAASGTAPIVMFNHFASPTLAASNAGVTTTYASTVRIDGPPIKGTNNTATDAVGLRIDNTGVGAHTRSWGLWVEASSGATNNYAAYLNGMVGISKIPVFTLDINGTANCTSNTWTSDERKKKNVQPLSLNGLDLIGKLNPVTFEWKEVKDDGMKGTQIGFIAQELERVIPTMVVTANDDEKSKGVKYNEFLPVLVKAIQEQQTIIEEQNKRIEKLEALMNTAQK